MKLQTSIVLGTTCPEYREVTLSLNLRQRGDDYYDANGITQNVEIPVENEFSIFEWLDSHSLDSYRPQLIYKLLINKTIKPIN